MKILLKILVSSLAVFISAYLLPGIHVDSFLTAIIVAAVLALLNAFLRPLLIFFTIPVTIFTLGLFLLVINAALIMLTSKIVDGFVVTSFWWAVLFSIILSIITSVLESLGMKEEKKDNNKSE